MADWFRVPLWCHGRERREEAAVAVYVLGEWHTGRAPSPLEIKTEFGWGWTRAARFLDTLWAWAGEANAVRPAASRAGPKAPKQASGEESGSDRGANGERSGSDDAGHKRIVEADRGAIGEQTGSDRGVSRARLPLETDEDERRRDLFAPAPAVAGAAPSPAQVPTEKPKRAKATKPTADPHPYHQRVIDAWDRTWAERNPGTPYPWSPRDVATLARAVRDPLVHRDERGVEDLQRVGAAFRRYLGQQVDGRYVRGLSIAGFARDPALWFVGSSSSSAEPAPRRRSSTRVPSLEELLNVNDAPASGGDHVVIDITPRTTCH